MSSVCFFCHINHDFIIFCWIEINGREVGLELKQEKKKGQFLFLLYVFSLNPREAD